MASRRGQGIWTEGPNVPFTTYKMPEVNRPAVVPPPNVNSGATRNYGGTPDNLNTVPSRYVPYRPPGFRTKKLRADQVLGVGQSSGTSPQGGTQGTYGGDPDNDSFFKAAREADAEPYEKMTWRGVAREIFGRDDDDDEGTEDVLDFNKPYSPSKAREVADEALGGWLAETSEKGRRGRRRGSKRDDYT
jgi:hypothetical protein